MRACGRGCMQCGLSLGKHAAGDRYDCCVVYIIMLRRKPSLGPPPAQTGNCVIIYQVCKLRPTAATSDRRIIFDVFLRRIGRYIVYHQSDRRCVI